VRRRQPALGGSVKNWLTLLVLGLTGFAMLVAWVYVVPPLRGRLIDQKLADARANARLISETVGQWVRYDPATGLMVDQPSLRRTVSDIAARLGGRVVLFTRTLVPREDSGGQEPVDVSQYPMLLRAVTEGTVQQGVVGTLARRRAATAVPLFTAATGRTPVAVVLVVTPLDDVENAVQAVQRQLFFATILALGASLLLGYLASYFIARRLKRIEASAEAIAGGDLSATVPVSGEDEIGQLAATFNVMAQRLADAFAQVEQERDRVEVLLNDLSEGVIGLAADGRVAIANPAAASLLDRAVPEGVPVEELLPDDVVDVWREALAEGVAQIVVFERGERTLEATAYPVTGSAGFTSIVVLRDVSAQARLERARRDLIANASHEFKTPLFSLSGSLELLDEGDLSPEEQREFLQVMRQQVDRLRNLAVAMLDLSRIEAGAFELHPEEVALGDVARSVLDEFLAQAQARQLRLEVESDPAHTAWCDEERLAQVLRALVDNAVKYSPEGGRVVVMTSADDDTAAVSVSDEGPGIPPEELPYVFERFHRGAKERAKTSGAGLGLSIARELTRLMGGSIAVTSPRGRGACFTVRLPRRAGRREAAAGGGRRGGAPDGRRAGSG